MAQAKKKATARNHSQVLACVEHCSHFLLNFASDLRLEEFSLATPEDANKARELFEILRGRLARKQETCAALERACLACSSQGGEAEEEGLLQ
jgi:hypothetical protein